MREIIVGRKYRHFKGNEYLVISIAMHTETKESLVIYQNVEDKTLCYARPYEMFVSKVDRNKYPEVVQEYRFELIEE